MRRTAAVLVVLVALTGCAGQSGPAGTVSTASRPSLTVAPSSSPPSGSVNQAAKATVLGYFNAISAHDPVAARTYLAPEYYKSFTSPAAFRAWLANYLSLTGLSVESQEPVGADAPAEHPGYTEFTELLVSYQAVLREPSGNEGTGRTERFIVLGRTGPAGPWVILDIASGR